MNWRTRAEMRLEKMGAAIAVHPKKTIFFILTLSLFFISNLPKITIDTSTEGFLHENDPALIRYEAFKEQFGQDEKIMVVVQTDDLFSFETLDKLRRLHNELENRVPHLNDITSLINARNTRGEGDRLIVEDLFEVWPEDEKALDAIKETAIKSEMYENLLLSKDLRLTTIILEPNAYEGSTSDNELEGFSDIEEPVQNVKFLSDKSKSQMVRETDAIIKEFSSDEFEVFIAGSLAVNDYIKASIQKDLQKFVKLVLLMMAIFLFVVFRRVSAVILPMFIVVISLLITLGIMALCEIPITIPTQILPSFLLAVGIGATVHLLAMFFKHFNQNGSKDKAVVFALGHSGLAIIMTSLTTAAGLLSFASAEIAPISQLGVFAAAGVMIALINTLTLLPAVLVILPLKPAKQKQIQKSTKMDQFLRSVTLFSLHHAKGIVFIGFMLFVLFMYSAIKLEFKHDALSWHPDDSPIKQATARVDKGLRGSVTVEVIVDTKKENGLYNAALLHKIDSVRKQAEEIKDDNYFVGKGWSIAEVLKEIHRALHGNNQEYYTVTDDDRLIPQEFLLFENSGSDDLEDLVDSSLSQTRITFKLPWMEAGEYTELNNKIKKVVVEEIGKDAEVTITGMVPLFQRTLVAAMSSMAMSYVIAFIMISAMMVILLGSFKVGMVSMIPNVLPVIITLGFMHMAEMPLDMFTMLVGAIIIGLSVDDTVHFFHNFARYRHQGKSVEASVEETMLGTGRAMVATTIVLSLGFFVYTFATLNNLINFGILTGGAIIVALLADILLAPALLKLLSKERQ